MRRRPSEFVVTHSLAPDPDRQRVEAALELWQGGLAERLLAEGCGPDCPQARFRSHPAPRARTRRLAGRGDLT